MENPEEPKTDEQEEIQSADEEEIGEGEQGSQSVEEYSNAVDEVSSDPAMSAEGDDQTEEVVEEEVIEEEVVEEEVETALAGSQEDEGLETIEQETATAASEAPAEEETNDDIYGNMIVPADKLSHMALDLKAFGLQDDFQISEEKQAMLKVQGELEKKVSGLEEQVKKLEKEKDILRKNISALYKTAKQQQEVRDARITSLQQRLDDCIFRRITNRQGQTVKSSDDKNEVQEAVISSISSSGPQKRGNNRSPPNEDKSNRNDRRVKVEWDENDSRQSPREGRSSEDRRGRTWQRGKTDYSRDNSNNNRQTVRLSNSRYSLANKDSTNRERWSPPPPPNSDRRETSPRDLRKRLEKKEEGRDAKRQISDYRRENSYDEIDRGRRQVSADPVDRGFKRGRSEDAAASYTQERRQSDKTREPQREVREPPRDNREQDLSRLRDPRLRAREQRNAGNISSSSYEEEAKGVEPRGSRSTRVESIPKDSGRTQTSRDVLANLSLPDPIGLADWGRNLIEIDRVAPPVIPPLDESSLRLIIAAKQQADRYALSLIQQGLKQQEMKAAAAAPPPERTGSAFERLGKHPSEISGARDADYGRRSDRSEDDDRYSGGQREGGRFRRSRSRSPVQKQARQTYSNERDRQSPNYGRRKNDDSRRVYISD